MSCRLRRRGVYVPAWKKKKKKSRTRCTRFSPSKTNMIHVRNTMCSSHRCSNDRSIIINSNTSRRSIDARAIEVTARSTPRRGRRFSTCAAYEQDLDRGVSIVHSYTHIYNRYSRDHKLNTPTVFTTSIRRYNVPGARQIPGPRRYYTGRWRYLREIHVRADTDTAMAYGGAEMDRVDNTNAVQGYVC
jgi:hypothetical protein